MDLSKCGDGVVEIREEVPGKGRALFAMRDVKYDEIVFEEKPLVSAQFSWNAIYRYTACDNCMKSLETAEEMTQRLTNDRSIVLPHPECCTVKKEEICECPHCRVLYCSPDCLEEAWSLYHKTLCQRSTEENQDHPLFKLDHAWRNMHFPPETATIMLIVRMIARVKQAPNKEEIISAFSKFCRATVNEEEEIAHKLLGEQFQFQLENLRLLLKEAIYDEDVHQWFTPEGFRSLFALIGTNGQGIGSSSIGTWARNCENLSISEEEKTALDSKIDQIYDKLDEVSGPFLNCEGSGLYMMQSLCNHSCLPNAEVTFPKDDFTLVLKATKDIKAGEEVNICYLDECDRERSRHSRQKTLRENYLFQCGCEKCLAQADEPDVTSEEDMDDSDDEGTSM